MVATGQRSCRVPLLWATPEDDGSAERGEGEQVTDSQVRGRLRWLQLRSV